MGIKGERFFSIIVILMTSRQLILLKSGHQHLKDPSLNSLQVAEADGHVVGTDRKRYSVVFPSFIM